MGVGSIEDGDAQFEFPDSGSPFLIEFRPVWVDGDPKPIEHEKIGLFDLQQMSPGQSSPQIKTFLGFQFIRRFRALVARLECIEPPPLKNLAEWKKSANVG